MDIINRIIYILTNKNLKQSDLCNYLNIKYNVFTTWKTRGTEPPTKYLNQICEFLDISIDYLLTGKEKSTPTNLSEDVQELISYYNELPESEKNRLIRRAQTLAELYNEQQKREEIKMTINEEEPEYITLHYFNDPASAGAGIELGDGAYEDIKVLANTLTIKSDIVIRVKGDSMQPNFNDGDLVLVRINTPVEIGEIGIFTLDGSDGVIKKKGKDRLISVNPNYDDIFYSDYQEIYTIGRVLGQLKPDWICN